MYTSHHLHQIIAAFKTPIEGAIVTRFHSISAARFALRFSNNRPTLPFLFCFEQPVRFHPVSSLPKEAFVHPYKKKLEGALLTTIEQINQDRIMRLLFKKEEETITLICEFFERHPNYYFLTPSGQIAYSLYPSKVKIYQPPPLKRMDDSSLSLEQMEEYFARLERDRLLKKLSAACHKKIRKQLSLMNILQSNLEKCRKWEMKRQEADLLKASFSTLKKGLSQITVFDWMAEKEIVLILDPLLEPVEQIAKAYKRAKKLKNGIGPLEKQLENGAKKLLELEKCLESFTSMNVEELQCQIPTIKTKESRREEKKKSYFNYLSRDGLSILIGKNARGNDELTFRIAKGNDWWLHVRDSPGSHVIIRIGGQEKPPADTLEDALQLALYHSKVKKRKEGEVCVTQRKFVTRLGKEPGKVQISRHRNYKVLLDLTQIERLRRCLIHHP
ncbi:MAG: NFACT RNA binding domain-containing protein [Parachlamydia sp.]|jgi:predicted ribosome quality control (RQC) complex YloA/Tae2 family protein|nr:NFACT RNA binding domain-containing protein [Parachlamydia sp.]